MLEGLLGCRARLVCRPILKRWFTGRVELQAHPAQSSKALRKGTARTFAEALLGATAG